MQEVGCRLVFMPALRATPNLSKGANSLQELGYSKASPRPCAIT